ncbi:hypothetical protein ElyMa_001902500 [Elysia marginata]|uniref:Uncharacterized protein n=1 Tax=Elysia marginata TaxID=1093978 RepID=A0AAV4ETJ5_9GAST|nr:hypothetical protein ElyMa_001902500 [Elysia marginata]
MVVDADDTVRESPMSSSQVTALLHRYLLTTSTSRHKVINGGDGGGLALFTIPVYLFVVNRCGGQDTRMREALQVRGENLPRRQGVVDEHGHAGQARREATLTSANPRSMACVTVSRFNGNNVETILLSYINTLKPELADITSRMRPDQQMTGATSWQSTAPNDGTISVNIGYTQNQWFKISPPSRRRRCNLHVFCSHVTYDVSGLWVT